MNAADTARCRSQQRMHGSSTNAMRRTTSTPVQSQPQRNAMPCRKHTKPAAHELVAPAHHQRACHSALSQVQQRKNTQSDMHLTAARDTARSCHQPQRTPTNQTGTSRQRNTQTPVRRTRLMCRASTTALHKQRCAQPPHAPHRAPHNAPTEKHTQRHTPGLAPHSPKSCQAAQRRWDAAG
jgi:hypothetical protein